MLNIYFGDMTENKEKYIYNTSMYFNNAYKDSWITSDFGKQVIKAVDNSTVVSEKVIDSPVLGAIPPEQLSGGVKTLLLIANDSEHIFNASTCGDNCAQWILAIAEMKAEQNQKVLINLRHIMDFGRKEFKIKILNSGKTVKNMLELVMEAGELV